MASDLFISYARKDIERVRPWRDALQQAGLSVWMDVSGIEGGSQWGQQIAAAIEESQVLLLMLSACSVASEHVLREVNLALEAKKPLLPLLLEPVEVPLSLRYPLAGLQLHALSGSDQEEQRQALLRVLARFGVTAHGPEGAAAAPALPAAPRPPAAANAPQHKLPRQLTSFIGRAEEIGAVKRRLAEAALVTLTGPGGTGKTRLALQVAQELLPDFADGVFLVPLEPITDPGLVPATIAQILGLKETPGQPLVENLKEYLREKQFLLVLDNFEQVLAGARLVTELLAAAPGLKVLVTSRAVLHLSGEQEYAVPPLPVPDLRRLPPLESLSQYAAVELFIQRARAVKPEFELTHENASAVAKICARLDGLPLAIELAAARVKLFSPEALHGRLVGAGLVPAQGARPQGSPLQLLTGGARDLPERQQTLRGAIAWSYELLSEPEKQLFRRLSIFVGGFTLEGAEVVCNRAGELELDVLEGVASLRDQSLLRQSDNGGGEPRFLMLETIREYAVERLLESGEAETQRRQHAAYFMKLTEAAEPALGWGGPEEAGWLQRLAAEHDNLRAALDWAVGTSPAAVGLRLAAALEEFWLRQGYLQEGQQWLAAVLARTGVAEPAWPRAKVLRAAGRLAFHQHDPEQDCDALMEESLALERRLGNKAGIAASLWHLANMVGWGDRERARLLLEESLALSRELGDRRAIALALGSLSWFQSDLDQARALQQESLAIHRQLGQRLGMAWSWWWLGMAASRHGDPGTARQCFEQALRLFREGDHRLGIASALQFLGPAALAQRDWEAARACFEEAASCFRAMGNKELTARMLHSLEIARQQEGSSTGQELTDGAA